MYAWGPNFKLKFEPLKDTPVPNLYEVKVEVSANGQGDTATFYVTKDGHFLIRAELEDITTDPAVKIRKQINTAGYPSKGPADAKVVLVEYADYECPSCRQLDGILRALLPTQPQVRLVYKDFPLIQIHPWAMTAATAGRCAYHQDPTAFWKFHDLLYDNQSIITPENAYQKMQDYATQSGLDANALKVCMADPANPRRRKEIHDRRGITPRHQHPHHLRKRSPPNRPRRPHPPTIHPIRPKPTVALSTAAFDYILT